MSSLIALVVSGIASGLATETVLGRHGWELNGQEHLRSITIDGHAEGIVEEDIRHYVDDEFPQPVDVTLAVRDADVQRRTVTLLDATRGVGGR